VSTLYVPQAVNTV